jgi:hypothetical protein
MPRLGNVWCWNDAEITSPARRAIATMGAQLIHYNSPSRADTSSTAQLNLVVEMVTSVVEAAKSRKPVDTTKQTNQSGSCLNMVDSNRSRSRRPLRTERG